MDDIFIIVLFGSMKEIARPQKGQAETGAKKMEEEKAVKIEAGVYEFKGYTIKKGYRGRWYIFNKGWKSRISC